MKAVFIEQYGGPEVLKYGDWPDPVAGAGEVVIDVVARPCHYDGESDEPCLSA